MNTTVRNLMLFAFCLFMAMPSSVALARNKTTQKNVLVLMPEQHSGHDCTSLVDSILGLIHAGDTHALMVDINALAGCLCNRYVQGDEAVDLSCVKWCALNSTLPMDSDFFILLMERLKLFNDKHKGNISVYGFDASTTPGSWIDDLNRIPEYKGTAIVDSLMRYCLDEEVKDIQELARRTEDTMASSKSIRKMLGNEFAIWKRYIHALSLPTYTMDYRYNKEEIEEAILEDYLWLDHRIRGKKLVICHKSLVQAITERQDSSL